MKEELKEWI